MLRGDRSKGYLPVAQYLAGRHGLRLIFAGTQFRAWGDLNTIQLPQPVKGLENEYEDALLGGTLHEARHIYESDFKIVAKVKEDEKYNLTNLFEDIRIEANAIQQYPGGKQIIERLDNYVRTKIKKAHKRRADLIDAGKEVPEWMKVKPIHLLGIAMDDIAKGRQPDLEIYDERFAWLADQMRDLIKEAVNAGFGKDKTEICLDLSVRAYQRLAELLPRRNQQQDSDDESDSDSIFEIPKSALEEDEDEDEEEQGKQGPNKNEQEEREEGEEEGNGSTRLDSEEIDEDLDEDLDEEEDDYNDDYDDEPAPPIPDGESQPIESVEEESQDGHEGDGVDECNEDDKEKNTDGEQADASESGKQHEMTNYGEPGKGNEQFENNDFVEEIMEEMSNLEDNDRTELINNMISQQKHDDIDKHQRHEPHPDIIRHDVLLHPNNPTRNDLDFGGAYTNMKQRVAPQIDLLRQRLIPLLISQLRGGWLLQQEEGDIDDARLYAIHSGYRDVYKKRIPRQKMNTAVTLLGDVSGSMSGQKIRQLQRCFVSCGEALEDLRIPFELLTFTTAGGYSFYDGIPRSGTQYNRWEPIKHTILKSFEERLHDCIWRLMSINYESYNCDPEAVWWAAERLMLRKEDRKILFVMHDGFPRLSSYETDNSKLNNELKIAVQTVMEWGIEIYGVGIMSQAPQQFYPPNHCFIIWEDAHIAEAIFTLLESKVRESVHAR